MKERVGQGRGEGLDCSIDPSARLLGLKGACPVRFPLESALTRQKRIKTLFHRLWSKAVSAADYDKREWQELQELMKIEELGGRGVNPRHLSENGTGD